MTKESRISLIAGAMLFGLAVISIVNSFSGRAAIESQSDAMTPQLYASNASTSDR